MSAPLSKAILIPITILYCVSLIMTVVLNTRNVNAAGIEGFSAGNIIDDATFYNSSALSTGQIQAFLEAKVPVCDTNGSQMYTSTQTVKQFWTSSDRIKRDKNGKVISDGREYPPYTCLKDYSQNTPYMNGESGICSQMPAKTARTAAQIIFDVAAACGVSQKVLLVLLQKEQSLVTDVSPLKNLQYGNATGFACPDTAPCDPNYEGFFYQVYYAARQYRLYAANPTEYNYIARQSNRIYYNPDSSCGSSWVYIENQATAGLYNYTPYQPNAATIKVPVGATAPCGAYGNKNFYYYFTSWFGSTQSTTPYAIRYDTTTDKSGEQARIGFGLPKKPTSPVTLTFQVNSPSNAKIINSAQITITSENWDKPEKNMLRIAGIDNDNLSGSFQYFLQPAKAPQSKDSRYSSLGPKFMDDIELIQLDSSSEPNVYRLYSSDLQQHTFTSNLMVKNQMISKGWRDEGIAFKYCRAGDQTIARITKGSQQKLAILNSKQLNNDIKNGYSTDSLGFVASPQGNIPVYYRYNTADPDNFRSLYTTSKTEALGAGSAWKDGGIAFYACSNTAIPIFRTYKPGGSHFFTQSAEERDKSIYQLGYEYEGLSFYACTNGSIPVYRFIKESTGVRFYTASPSEKNKAENELKYRYEGVGFRLCDKGSTPIYRLYQQFTGHRLYTTSTPERDKAVKNYGYRYEGVTFYAL